MARGAQVDYDWQHLPAPLVLGVQTDPEIGRALGCSRTAVKKARDRLGIPPAVGHGGRPCKGADGGGSDEEIRRWNEAAARRRAAEVRCAEVSLGCGLGMCW